jgi:gliding motility-associated-like protein
LTGASVGCQATQTVAVNVTATPTVSASSSNGNTICSTQSTTLSANGAGSYTWTPGNNTSSSFPVSPANTTTYTVVGVNGNCVDTNTVVVNVIPTPTVAINASGPAVCAGQTATLTASGAANYTWMPGGATTPTITDAPASTTTYTVTGDNNGCTSTQNISVTVNQLPVLSPVSGQTVCAGTSVNAINYNVNPGSTNVSWTNTDPNIGIAGSGNGNIAGYSAPNVTGTETGVITAIPTDGTTGCVGAPQSYTVTVYPSPTVSGGATDTAKCGATNGGVNGISVSGGTPAYHYQWYNGSTPMVGDTLPTLSNVAGGSYSISITDANGCSALGGTTVFTIPATTAVSAAFTPSILHGQAPLNVSFNNTSTGANAYNWNLGNGTSSQANPSTTYNTQGTYTVLLTASNGSCWDTAAAYIIVDEATSIVIPNIYSPNGDGVNDEFVILCTGMRTLHCDIYNRWGQLVYTLTAPDDKWDGKLNNGNNASEGTYYFILNAEGFDGKAYSHQGSLTLVK